MSKLGNSIQTSISFAVYILSGFFIFSPIHKSENLPLSLLCALITSFIVIYIQIFIISKSKNTKNNHKYTAGILIFSTAVLSLFMSLMLLTEIIKDIAYIANRNIGLFYYTVCAAALLSVSLALSMSKNKGIFRFSILAVIPFFVLFLIIFLAPAATKSIVGFHMQGSISSAFLTGAKAGLFYAADTSLFLLCFEEQIKEDGIFPKRNLFLGYIFAFTFIIIYNLLTSFVFGTLTREISDPDYALVKLIDGIDMTEIISAVRIVSFLIKSSVYISLSAQFIKNILPKIKKDTGIILILYSLIPASFLCLAIFDKSLEYGAFQHLIYPVNIILSLCFTLISSHQKKQ